MKIVEQNVNDPRPFGAQTHHSPGPLVLLAGLYLIWFAFMVYLAINYPARPARSVPATQTAGIGWVAPQFLRA